MTRIINTLLIVVALAGLAKLSHQRQEFHYLKKRHDRLADKYGVLDVQDSSKYIVRRLETADPKHFLWRCYFPAGLNVTEVVSMRGGMQSSGSTFRRDASEFLQRCRFKFGDSGISVHYMERGGGGRFDFNAPIALFLKEHWDELEFEVLAEDGDTIEIPTDQALSFLTIRIPRPLIAELPKNLREEYASGIVFQMLYGTDEAIAALKKKPEGAR